MDQQNEHAHHDMGTMEHLNPQAQHVVNFRSQRSLDIHELKLRDADLNENSTRYDNIVAGGSDKERFIQWVVWSTISLLVATFVLIVFTAIVTKRSVRRRPFNLYLLFLIIPDFIFSFFCGINCALNAARGDFVSAGWCRFQVVYSVFGIGSNAWLNAVVARHIVQMLQCGKRMKRYFAPRRRQVVIESMAVYAWVGFLCSWPFIDKVPQKVFLSSGLGCIPQEYDRTSTFFHWLVFTPLFAFIPIAYTIYAFIHVWRKDLLPSVGRSRDIAIYFFRLTVVFLIMWIPAIFFLFLATGFSSSWVAFVGGCWSHLQGGISALFCLLKQDIGEAFVQFVTCGRKTIHRSEISTSQTIVNFRSLRISGVDFYNDEKSSEFFTTTTQAPSDHGDESKLDGENDIERNSTQRRTNFSEDFRMSRIDEDDEELVSGSLEFQDSHNADLSDDSERTYNG